MSRKSGLTQRKAKDSARTRISMDGRLRTAKISKLSTEQARITTHDTDDDAAMLREHAQCNGDQCLNNAAAKLTRRRPLKAIGCGIKKKRKRDSSDVQIIEDTN